MKNNHGEKESTELVGKKARKRIYFNIKTQLAIGFIIPIIFVVLVGVVSYQKAETGMVSNYENTITSSMNMGMKYLDLGFELVSSEALQLAMDETTISYTAGNSDSYSKIQDNLLVKATSNNFFESIQVVPNKGISIISTQNPESKEGYFQEWIDSEEGQAKIGKSIGNSWVTWIGKHEFVDEKTGINPDRYAFSCVALTPNGSACAIVDISSKVIEENLRDLNLGAGSIAAFITPDNRETIVRDNNDVAIIFSEQEFYRNCINAEEAGGTAYVRYEDKEYFFIYSKSSETDSIICALVPEAVIITKAVDIKNVTFIFVILACIIAVAIAAFISVNIGVNIDRITKKLNIASKGDLTVDIKTKGQNEFSILARNIITMIMNTRNLIIDLEQMIGSVSGAANQVGTVSDTINDYSEKISNAVNEIDLGVAQQADDAQDSLVQMNGLSQQIEIITEEVVEVERFADSTKEMIIQGIGTMKELSKHSISTKEITGKVKSDIIELEKKSIEIGKIVNIINEISRQTNLLSLNASIEAARAGDAGKGFTVVAAEIRALADGSQEAAKEIKKMVEAIGRQTTDTIAAANNAELIVEQQSQIVFDTVEAFQRMNECTERLLNKLQQIVENVETADTQRKETLHSIENTSAVLQQTAASSSVVNEIAKGQMKVAETLKNASGELNNKMLELKNALKLFKIK